jgi:hypothetical protein
MEVWSALRSGHFAPREKAPGIHWIEGCVGSRADLVAVAKRKIPSPRWDSNPPIIQPVAQSYTTELSRLLIVISFRVKFILCLLKLPQEFLGL